MRKGHRQTAQRFTLAQQNVRDSLSAHLPTEPGLEDRIDTVARPRHQHSRTAGIHDDHFKVRSSKPYPGDGLCQLICPDGNANVVRSIPSLSCSRAGSGEDEHGIDATCRLDRLLHLLIGSQVRLLPEA